LGIWIGIGGYGGTVDCCCTVEASNGEHIMGLLSHSRVSLVEGAEGHCLVMGEKTK